MCSKYKITCEGFAKSARITKAAQRVIGQGKVSIREEKTNGKEKEMQGAKCEGQK